MRKAHDDLLALEPPPMRVAYLIWREPWMAIGEDTFIADMLFQARLSLVDLGAGRFPTFEPEALGAADPDLVLLSSEPFPFKRKHADELAERSGLPRDRFVGVDGELVSWHGTRVRAGLEALGQWRVGHFPVLPT
jgi:ABC-type Fe3+-hydroxamate transport system substrate-binding protein